MKSLFAIVTAAALAFTAWQALGRSGRAEPANGIGYPAGPWWRADIDGVVLSPAHILIRFSSSEPRDGDVQVPGVPAKRTRAEALRLIAELRAKLATDASRFAELAREYSEDETTRARGGRLGVMRAPSLPPAFVDALGYLEVGEISRPVETALGFHLIERRKVGEARRVSGSEIVIAYQGLTAPTRPGRKVTRNREQAKLLAARVFEEARRAPERFEELVEKYSDAVDAVQGGDLGEWSTYEVGDSVVLDTLAEMRAGDVAPPLDDAALGMRILKRTERSRPIVAASVFIVGHALEPRPTWVDPSITRSFEQARDEARELVAILAANPERFDELGQRHCDYRVCRIPPQPYPAGRSPWVGLDRKLLETPVGGVVSEPVVTPIGFAIARREAPGPIPANRFEATTELPNRAEAQNHDFAKKEAR